MLEQGLVQLVNADATVAGITTNGGFGFDELAKDTVLPSWAFRFSGGKSYPTLLGARGFRWRRLEIHCMANDADTVILLSTAINAVLEGFSGNLPDGTMIDCIYNENSPIDFFDASTRTYRRVHEYEVYFIPSTPGE
jgi:hypothetical protein